MNTDLLRDLADQWRADAERLREYGSVGAVKACEKHAEELERRIREWEVEALSVDEAASESAYSRDRLYELVSDGTIPNAGRKGAPQIRRCDLPRKPGQGDDGISVERGDFADEILEARGAL